MAYQALPRELPGPATLRRRPRGVVGQGEPQKLNQPAPDGPDWNQPKRGIRLGPDQRASVTTQELDAALQLFLAV